ncbi:[histone H3]-dimethyl-L-lysine(36) demethylase [Malassezia nana]|uniref:[histone H3]-dimethyl-L-lysine(36) demethylase n=1 Tax=Malassezia nana TaxID=180528 RepID=A0AAF0EM16_9BASI|nr:[histone H3]-dimethyl-L-lysine(36) demethylase [Malassezia nana]
MSGLVHSVAELALAPDAPRSPTRRVLCRIAHALLTRTNGPWLTACECVQRQCDAVLLLYPFAEVPASVRAERADATYLTCAVALAQDTHRPFSFWLQCVYELDRAILHTRPPDLTIAHALLAAVQDHCPVPRPLRRSPRLQRQIYAPPRTVPTATRPVPDYAVPPDAATFSAHCGPTGRPLVVRGYAQSWPALVRWQDIHYLLHRAGPGRHVPVEKGRTYTDLTWGQVLYPWDAFLTHIQWGSTAALRAPILYLAQHTLLAQFPWMADDFTPPAYAAHDARVQVWMGPAGATSPAHTDPYDNCYVQVVGHKLVWLAPPTSNCTGALNVFGGPDDTDICTRHMRNTSQVNVFGPRTAAPAAFRTQVVPSAEWVYLHPGDLLLHHTGM